MLRYLFNFQCSCYIGMITYVFSTWLIQKLKYHKSLFLIQAKDLPTALEQAYRPHEVTIVVQKWIGTHWAVAPTLLTGIWFDWNTIVV